MKSVSILCVVSFKGTWNEHLHKMVYIKNRRYLPLDSDLRSDDSGFPDQSVENSAPPRQRDYEKLKSVHHAYDKTKIK